MIDPKKEHTSPLGHLPRRTAYRDIAAADGASEVAEARECTKTEIAGHKVAITKSLRKAVAAIPAMKRQNGPKKGSGGRPAKAGAVSARTEARRRNVK